MPLRMDDVVVYCVQRFKEGRKCHYTFWSPALLCILLHGILATGDRLHYLSRVTSSSFVAVLVGGV